MPLTKTEETEVLKNLKSDFVFQFRKMDKAEAKCVLIDLIESCFDECLEN